MKEPDDTTESQSNETEANCEQQESATPPSGSRTNTIERQAGELETLERFLNEAFASEIPPDPKPEEDEPEPEDFAEDMSDPNGRAQVRGRQAILDSIRSRLRTTKRREELYQRADAYKNGPRGEKRSAVLTRRVEMVSLKHIIDDPEFVNLRTKAEESELQLLTESMKHEGLKVPITLISAFDDDVPPQFFIRAGFRRTTVARQLGWQKIPAVVLPANTPQIEEYWTNIIENSARSRLHTYETAVAAKTMRDKFHVSPVDFARRAGYSDSHVYNLLRCIDRLPQEILDVWKDKSPIPVDYYIKWSLMEPDEAVKMMLSYAGRNQQLTNGWQPPTNLRRPVALKMASSRGLQRMQRVRFAVEVAQGLDEKTRSLCLKLVDYCTGAREDVPGVFDPRQKQRRYVSRRKEDLKMPELGDEAPPPVEDPDDKEKIEIN